MDSKPDSHNKQGRINGYTTKHHCDMEVREIAKMLGYDIVRYVTNNNQCVPSVSVQTTTALQPVSKTLRRTVDELSQRHQILFRNMVNKLNITMDNLQQVFVNIADEIFKDKQYNWGRIVSVYAFGARLAKFASDNHLTSSVDVIGEIVGSYVSSNLSWWIEKNGGWCAFQLYFPEPVHAKMEENIWKGLLATAGVGLAALAAVVAVR